MDNPLVSLLVPVYNVQDYLAECLDSLVNQTLREIEIIIINDGSTDGSRAVAEEYCSKDPRIRLINQENRGPGAARNALIAHASGDYILIVDSDDYLDLSITETLYKKAKALDTQILMYNGRAFYDYSDKQNVIEGKSSRIVYSKKGYLKFKKSDEKAPVPGILFASRHSAIAATYVKLYKRQFLRDNNVLFPENMLGGEDVEFNYRSMIMAEKVAYTHCFGYFRRFRPNSIMTGGSLKNITDRIHGFPELAKLLQLKEFTQYAVLQHKKNLAAQFALYAAGLWVVAMCYKDKTVRTQLVSDCYRFEVCKFISCHKKGIFLWAASCMTALPVFFQPLMHIACITVKRVFRSRSDLFI